MNPKDILTNKAFCPIPWAGFYIGPDGEVKNCICSKESIGNTRLDPIVDILKGPINTQVKVEILDKQKPHTCSYCYSLEENKNSLDIVSSRVYYMRELKSVNRELYADPGNFDLNHIDIRWRNTCNFACVYCGPTLSSKWASELKVEVPQPSRERFAELKQYVFDNAHQLKNIYMAGGEPLLIKENEELLELLLKVNPNVTLRVNTNLSQTDTKVLDLLCKFKNVHWTVSAESIEEKFEYMRYGGNWVDFNENLKLLQTLPHKITFNMLWGILNYYAIYECIDHFRALGFHQNSFILTAITGPAWLDTRHLPDDKLKEIDATLHQRIAERPGFLLEDGYRNLSAHINKPFDKTLPKSFSRLKEIDQRRGLDSSKIFTDLYDC